MIKFERNEKYNTIAAYVCVTAAVIVAIILVAFNLSSVFGWFRKLLSILTPMINGAVIAYLLNNILGLFERRIFSFITRKKDRRRLLRILSLAATYLVALLVVVLFLLIVVPQIIRSYTDLQSKAQGYINSAQTWANDFVRDSPLFNGKYADLSEFINAGEVSEVLNQIITAFYGFLESVPGYLISYGITFINTTANLVIGLFISIYILASKERLSAQAKKLLTAVTGREKTKKIVAFTRYTDKTFGGFIIGKIVGSSIVGLVFFTILSILKIPFAPLIAVILGVTNVIPFFGPFLGAIPSAFIILIAAPDKVIAFAIVVLLVQQIDGNFVEPMILGDSTGLSSLMVIVAILVMGGFFGMFGMFVGVPVFAVLYSLFKLNVEKKLAKAGCPEQTSDYYPDGFSPPDQKQGGIIMGIGRILRRKTKKKK